MSHNPADFGDLNAAYEQLAASDRFYATTLSDLNGSGVTGGVLIGLDTDTNMLTVISVGENVEASQPHPIHIHGFDPAAEGSVQESVSPTMAQDTDGDGFIELAEAAGQYGPIQLSLTDPVGGALEGFPAPDDGVFVRTTIYDLNALDNGAVNNDGEGLPLSETLTGDNLALREIVLHGASVDGSTGMGTEGEVDGIAGYKATLPVAVGELSEVDAIAALADLTGDGRLMVGDDVVALDIGGTAGMTWRLYEAVLGRAPDQDGLSFWVEAMDDGLTMEEAANELLMSDEFTARFGSNASLSNEELVDQLYMNILGREGEAEGEMFWNDVLDDGVARADVLIGFSESPENQMAVMGDISGGILLNGDMMA